MKHILKKSKSETAKIIILNRFELIQFKHQPVIKYVNVAIECYFSFVPCIKTLDE